MDRPTLGAVTAALLVSAFCSNLSVAEPACAPGILRADCRGDPLPPGAVGRLGTVRWRSGWWTEGLLFVPGTTQLASHRADAISFWDRATGKELRRLTVDNWVTALAVSPDGSVLASGDYGQTISLWDVATGKELRRLEGHVGAVVALAFSPDGRTLASGAKDEFSTFEPVGGGFTTRYRDADKTIRLWDVSSGKEIGQILGHGSFVKWLSFLADGKQLLSASNDGTIRLWDVVTRSMVRELPEADGFESLCVIPRQSVLAGVFWKGNNSELRRWDFGNGNLLATWLDIPVRPSAIAASSDGRTLAVAVKDAVCLVDARTGKPRQRLSTGAQLLRAVRFSADGKHLAACDGASSSLSVWDVATGNALGEHGGHRTWVKLARFLPQERFATVGDDELWLWDSAGRCLERTPLGDEVTVCDISRDGTRLLWAERWGRLTVLDVRTAKVLARWPRESMTVDAACFSTDGTVVAIAESKAWQVRSNRGPPPPPPPGLVYTWTSSAGRRKLGDSPSACQALAFSPDGKTLLGGSRAAARAAAWDLPSRKALGPVEEVPETFVGFTPDGRFLLGISVDDQVSFYDRHSRKKVHSFGWGTPHQHSDALRSLLGGAPIWALSPDGTVIALVPQWSGRNYEVQLRHCPSGRLLGYLKGHRDQITSISFSADGKRVITASGDTTALVWDVHEVMENHSRQARQQHRDLEKLWTDLGAADKALAHETIDQLVQIAERSLPLLRERLKAVSTEPVALWISWLDSPEYAKRREGQRLLAEQEFAARAALQEALSGNASLEFRRRVEALLAKLKEPVTTPSVLRAWRCVTVLEQIGNPEARQVLKRLARGACQGHLTEKARAALNRLARWPALD